MTPAERMGRGNGFLDRAAGSLAWATPASRALDPVTTAAEEATASSGGVNFIAPTRWICASDSCPLVVGRFLAYRDTHHLTRTYARALAPRLWRALTLAGAG